MFIHRLRWQFWLSNFGTWLFKCHTNSLSASSRASVKTQIKTASRHLSTCSERCWASQRRDEAGQSLWKSPSLSDYLRLMAYSGTALTCTLFVTVRFYSCKIHIFRELPQWWRRATAAVKYTKKRFTQERSEGLRKDAVTFGLKLIIG